MREIVLIALGAILVAILFIQIPRHMPVSRRVKKSSTAIGMGGAVIFVMTLASAVTWTVYRFFLEPNNLDYLQTIVFILVIAALVQFVEIVLKRFVPALFKALGIYLPLITTNCAVLGVVIEY